MAKAKSDYVFTRESGKCVRDFRRMWARTCEAANVQGMLFHDLGGRRLGISAELESPKA